MFGLTVAASKLHRVLMFTGWCMAAASAHAELKISGSDTLENYFQDATNQFTRAAGIPVPVTASYKGTSAGFRDLCEGRAMLAPASTRIDADTARKCESTRVVPLELPLAHDAVVVIAHPNRAGLGELSMAELKTIFHPDNSGKVTRWSQVRATAAEAPLTVISLDPRSGTNAFFGAKVHGLRGFVRPDAKGVVDNAEVIRLVAADPGAIGFVSLAALAESKAAVWRVPVNFGNGPVLPSRESVLNTSYAPLSRQLYLYVNKAALQEREGHTRQFLVWMMERGAKLATYEGFVPLTDRDYQDNLRKLGGAQ